MTKRIEDYSAKELYELAVTKAEEERKSLRPKVVCSINCSGVEGLVSLAEKFLRDEEDILEVDTQYAYQALMEFVYGNEVWDYINGLGG